MADYYFPEIDAQGNILSPDVRTNMTSVTLGDSGLNLVPNPSPESSSGWMPVQAEMTTFSDRPDIRALASTSNGINTVYLFSPSTTQSFKPGDSVRVSAYVEFSIPSDATDQTAVLRMRVHSKTNNHYSLPAMATISPTGKMQVIEQEVTIPGEFPPGPLEVSFTTNKVVPEGSIIKAAKVSVVRIPNIKTTSVVAGSLYGPGRPDIAATTGGIVVGTEMVGTTYTSTDGAGVGAWVWRKRPSNVWAVTDGDTGWRALGRWSGGEVTGGDVPASIGPKGTESGGIFLRRVNSVVTLSVVEGVALQANPEIPNIAGFRGNAGAPYPAIPLYYRLPSGAEAIGNIDVGAALYRLRVPKGAILASFGSGGYGVQGDWTTGYTDWPTTLPGTPA